MRVRFYLDPETNEPHIYAHGVNEVEVHDVLRKPLEEMHGRAGSMGAIGQTRAGRYLRVIYAPDDDDDEVFVITAYDLPAKQVRALRRRLRRKPS